MRVGAAKTRHFGLACSISLNQPGDPLARPFRQVGRRLRRGSVAVILAQQALLKSAQFLLHLGLFCERPFNLFALVPIKLPEQVCQQ